MESNSLTIGMHNVGPQLPDMVTEHAGAQDK